MEAPPVQPASRTTDSHLHKSMTLSCLFILEKLNKCVVVCDSVFQKGHRGDGCLSSSILFKYESMVVHCSF